MLRPLLIASLFFVSAPAFAIYKCESAGKISYSDIACPGDQITKSSTDEGGKISPADVARARQQAAREKNEVTRIEKERHRREAAEEREQRQAGRIVAAKKKSCATLAQRKKWSEEDAARAIGRAAEKARRKAHRMTEKYEAEKCPQAHAFYQEITQSLVHADTLSRHTRRENV